MKDDNNPFRPALSQPATDSVLATDPNADNFLAGSDGLQARATLDGMALDNQRSAQADTASASTAGGASSSVPNDPLAGMDLSSLNSNLGGASDSSVPATPVNDILSALNDTTPSALPPAPAPEKKVKKGFSLGKKKDAKSKESTTTDLFSSSTADTATPSFDPLDPAPASNPINDSLSAAAAKADGKSSDLKIADSKKASVKSAGQTKQLTVSLLTIIFAVAFFTSAGLAIWLFTQNSDLNNQLSDANAELAKYKDESTSSADSSNKASNNYDSLTTKVEELTKTNEENAKTIEENTKTIEDLTKEKEDLQTQLSEAQSKITSDENLTKSFSQVLDAMCSIDTYSSSTACQNRTTTTDNNGITTDTTTAR